MSQALFTTDTDAAIQGPHRSLEDVCVDLAGNPSDREIRAGIRSVSAHLNLTDAPSTASLRDAWMAAIACIRVVERRYEVACVMLWSGVVFWVTGVLAALAIAHWVHPTLP